LQVTDAHFDRAAAIIGGAGDAVQIVGQQMSATTRTELHPAAPNSEIPEELAFAGASDVNQFPTHDSNVD
jgi:hypothetical protein